MKKLAPKWAYIVLPLIIVVLLLVGELTMAISPGNSSFLDMFNFAPQFSPAKYYVKLPNKNPDNTYTLTINFSQLANAEEKGLFFNRYTALHLKPIIGSTANSVTQDQTFDIDLPNNIPSSVPYNNSSIYPNQFVTLVGKSVSLQITVKELKQNYRFSDIKGWSLLAIE